MARKSKAAAVYAKTLLDVATAQGALEATHAEFGMVSEVFAKTPGLKEHLTSPVVDEDRKKDLLLKAFRGHFSPLSLRFIDLLAQKGRLAILDEAAEEFRDLADERLGLVRATVVSAVPLDGRQVERIGTVLEKSSPGKRFLLQNEIDPSLIAGFRIVHGDTVIDASVRNKLSELRRKLAA